MADHVAVLRVLRDFYSGSVLNHAEKAAALDHAIATCEQHAALVAERDDYRTAAAWEAKRADEMQAKHAALVARLGELERVFRRNALVGLGKTDRLSAEQCQTMNECADDLARVVKPEGGGDGR